MRRLNHAFSLFRAGAHGVIIDDFLVPQAFGDPTVDSPTILGGERDLVSGSVSGGALTILNAGNVVYDGDDDDAGAFPPVALMSVDLTDGGLSDRFLLEFPVGCCADSVITLDAFFGGAPPSMFSTAVFFSPSGPTEVLFSSMLGPAADYTSITGVSLQVFGNVSINNFCTGNEFGCVAAPTVPEPSSMLLLLGGLLLAAGGMRASRR